MSTLTGALIGALLAGGGAAGTAPKEAVLDPLASQATRERVGSELAALERPVRLRVFTQERGESRMNDFARRLARGLADLSDKVHVEAYSLETHSEEFARHRIERTPAIAVVGEEDVGVRFYGVPGGHEVDSLVRAIRLVSSGRSGLSEASREALARLKEPVHIEVFVTLSCGFCPEAVTMADRLAVESEHVTAAMVELSAFPDYATERGVDVVPKVMVNGQPCFEGRRGEDEFVAAVIRCAEREQAP